MYIHVHIIHVYACIDSTMDFKQPCAIHYTHTHTYMLSLGGVQAKFGCSTLIVFRRWGERPNVITVGIGWVLLASATSRFRGSSSSIGKSI